MNISALLPHTASRAALARHHATWHLNLYGTRIPIDNDEGHPTWVTLIPVCPHCSEPAGHDRRATVRIDPDLPWRPILVCQCCEGVLGPLEETGSTRTEFARCQALVDQGFVR